ncbi:lipase member K-like [Kogia breviceps]|uniref:lipase member K-like n=1 Tax=Kogia breviceps TaxID=27615 RepID=UPI0027957C61|nr:lipase member K-like [Kogia breviceps]
MPKTRLLCTAAKTAVYLQHGLIASASNWICNLANNSLPFLLADVGYDVWMGNSWGNTWSRRHVKLSTTSPEYWAFRFSSQALKKCPYYYIESCFKYSTWRSRLEVYLSQSPAGTSVQNMLHWAQAVNSGQFQAFDWGNHDQNMMHFHQHTPPLYNVSKMEVPTAVWSGGQDPVADLKDVENLLPKITRLIYFKLILHYNHVDFYLGQDAPYEVYH